MENNVKISKISLIIWGSLYSVLIMPFGATIVPFFNYEYTPLTISISNFLIILIILLSPILLIISAISSRKNRLFKKWKKLFGVILLINILILISNYVPFLSAVGQLGYAQLVLPDIFLRAVALFISYKLVSRWIEQAYPAEMVGEGQKIMQIFGNTQIITFLIIEILAYAQFVFLVK